MKLLPKLPVSTRRAIAQPDNEILVSSASAWEIATKHRRGKLPKAGDVAERFEHYVSASRLTGIESVAIVTADPIFADYHTKVVWR